MGDGSASCVKETVAVPPSLIGPEFPKTAVGAVLITRRSAAASGANVKATITIQIARPGADEIASGAADSRTYKLVPGHSRRKTCDIAKVPSLLRSSGNWQSCRMQNLKREGRTLLNGVRTTRIDRYIFDRHDSRPVTGISVGAESSSTAERDTVKFPG